MLIFRDVSIQASPKPLIFLENAEPCSRFCEALELKGDARIFCRVMSLEDGTEPLQYYDAELEEGYCGIATVDERYSQSDIYIYLAKREFDFFAYGILALGSHGQAVRLTAAPHADFKIAKRLRVHSIHGNPSISFAPGCENKVQYGDECR